MMVDIDLRLGDCLEILPTLADNSVDAAITDPPYNIGKASWDKIPNYIEWCGLWFLECQRILKDNGSFYFCHNDIEQVAELIVWIKANTDFVLKQFIVWNKRFDGYHNQIHAVIHAEETRNYPKIAEYILFYTFQDDTGLTTVKLDMNNFTSLRQYFKDYQKALGLSKKQLFELIGQEADHCFRWGSSQWDMPTKETYTKLNDLPLRYVFLRREYVFFRREYKDLRREYEDLRREYEGLRYTFNNQKTHHSVWTYEIAQSNGHITPKPVPLMENILLHSTNPGDTILDPFMGSGTTGVACIQTGRNFIGIEIEPKYFEIAQARIAEAQLQIRMEL